MRQAIRDAETAAAPHGPAAAAVGDVSPDVDELDLDDDGTGDDAASSEAMDASELCFRDSDDDHATAEK